MTAAATRPPFAAASPAEIRAALVSEERSRFDREYRQALEVAAETFSLEGLEATLYTREDIPAEEALPVTKARLGY